MISWPGVCVLCGYGCGSLLTSSSPLSHTSSMQVSESGAFKTTLSDVYFVCIFFLSVLLISFCFSFFLFFFFHPRLMTPNIHMTGVVVKMMRYSHTASKSLQFWLIHSEVEESGVRGTWKEQTRRIKGAIKHHALNGHMTSINYWHRRLVPTFYRLFHIIRDDSIHEAKWDQGRGKAWLSLWYRHQHGS